LLTPYLVFVALGWVSFEPLVSILGIVIDARRGLVAVITVASVLPGISNIAAVLRFMERVVSLLTVSGSFDPI
jgi:hypothetical protein